MTRVLALLLVLLSAVPALAQTPVSLWNTAVSGTIDSAGDDKVELVNAGTFGTVGVTVTGTFTGTIEIQCSQNGSTFQALQIKPTNTGTLATSITTTGMWQAAVAGCRSVRAFAPSVFSSGTAVITLLGASVGGGVGAGGGGGAGTEFAEDSAHSSGANGTLFLGVRNDAGTVLCDTTLDYCPPSFDSTGALRVSGGATGGTSSNYGAAFPTAGTAIGFTDGTNMVAGRAVDADTGAGTFNVPTFNLVFRTAGTPVEAGTASNPFSTNIIAALPAGDNNIGNVDIVSMPSVGISTFPDNEPFNIAQMNGVAVTMGNGAAGTGVQRVTIASDSTGTLAVTQATASNLNAQVAGVAAHDAAASGNPLQIAGFGSSTLPTAVSANGDVTRVWTSLFGAPNVIMRDSAGDSAMDDTNNALRVNIVAGAGSGGTAMTDSAAFTVAVTSFTPIGGTYRSVLDPVTDNDGGAFAMTQRRALHGSIRRESDGAEWGIAATAPFAVRFSDGTSFLNLASDSTHDSAVSTTGPLSLLEAVSDVSANTAVADGDAVRQVADVLGRAIQIVGCDRAGAVGGVTTITDGSSTAGTGLGAQGAGIYNEVRTVTIVNTSTTPVSVDMRDGTAGSVLWTFPVPAATGQTHGGVTMNFDVPRYGTANTAIAFDPSAAATSIIISASGCKVK